VLLEGGKREGNMNSIVASPVWKYDTQKCVDASPLIVSDGSEIILSQIVVLKFCFVFMQMVTVSIFGIIDLLVILLQMLSDVYRIADTDFFFQNFVSIKSSGC